MYQSHPAEATTTRQPAAPEAPRPPPFRSGSSSIASTTPSRADSPAVTDPKIAFRAPRSG